MIKGITSNGRYIQVSGGGTSWPYVNQYSGSLNVGQLRYNPSSQNMEVYDGNNWQIITASYATVQLNGEAESLLDWAREQRNKQWEMESLAKDHPAVKNAIEAVNRAKEQLDLVYKLSKEEYNDFGEVQASP